MRDDSEMINEKPVDVAVDRLTPAKPPDADITPELVANSLQLACWSTLLLFPFLYYANGPAVSRDQLVVRTCLVLAAAVGAIFFAVRRWLRPTSRQPTEYPHKHSVDT